MLNFKKILNNKMSDFVGFDKLPILLSINLIQNYGSGFIGDKG